MTKKTTTEATRTKHPAKKPVSAGKAISWEVTLPRPRRRWWNNALLIVGTLWAASLVAFLQNYGFSAVLVLGVTAYLLTRQRQEETHSFQLDGTVLTDDSKPIDLTGFKGFELQELPSAKGGAELPIVLILVPKRFFGLGNPVYLPTSPEEAEAVLAALPQDLAHLNDDAIDGMNRIVNRLIRWLRLG